MTAVHYLWRRGDGFEAPEVKPPTSCVCDVETPEDEDYFVCDRYKGHDGPHAQWHFSTGELLAVWTDEAAEA